MEIPLSLEGGTFFEILIFSWYAIIASIVGAVLGTICTWFIHAAVTEQLTLTVPPVLPILTATICSVSTCMGATLIPLRRIGSMNIVDSIEAVE